MKSVIKFALITLVATLVLAGMPTDAEGEIYEDTIRLHILANSDSREDQELKLEIRDRMLNKYGEILRKSSTKSEAESVASELLPEIVRNCEEWICEMGYDYDVNAEIGVEWYETRDYGDFSLPCGYYTSLRVLIGSGEGQNWWCVMYPPLCTELATEDAPGDDGVIDYTKEELLLINSGKYQVKFKILEELSRTFAKNG